MIKRLPSLAGLLIVACLATFTHTTAQTQRYADHSVLASGKWAKIRVPQTGIYQLTDNLVQQAGFGSLESVRVYGYGGAIQPEKLTPDYLTKTDDLKQVPTCLTGGRLMFQANGPVSWESQTATTRLRNPYSMYGYYFLTDGGEEPLRLDADEFLAGIYPNADDYHTIYEDEGFSWYHGGRNLFDSQLMSIGSSFSYTLPAYSASGKLTVAMSYDNYCDATVMVNDSLVGNILVSSRTASSTNSRLKSFPDDYSKAAVDSWIFNINGGLKEKNVITITQTSGANMRLDHIILTSASPKNVPNLNGEEFPVPEFVGNVAHQDHHADAAADMVIIIPASGLLRDEAERLKQLHSQYDGLRVTIVTADELFNEFSSGTPDANAYRRYLKMLYDRAETNGDKPRYLLLFGDGAWDNRMMLPDWALTNPDDFLLCYESENSFSETKCYVSDDYFCLLNDNEGGDLINDKSDVAVGRLPARDAKEAKILVDKLYSYRSNEYAGPWQNVICMMGDDGDKNRHMDDAEIVIEAIGDNGQALDIRKIYWDAYELVNTSSGKTYPDVRKRILQQMEEGALVMDYTGHGNAGSFSHESVLFLNDFRESQSMHLPLWVTASCDIMPFDGQVVNNGETAMLNPHGGAIAFFGTTRTVYATYNRPINQAFMRHVLGTDSNGQRISIGEAVRLAKNEFSVGSSRDMIINKMQFTLLGDPALKLAKPELDAVIDNINGQQADSEVQRLGAGTMVTVEGHIQNEPFDGLATLTVRDALQTITGRCNDTSATPTPIVFTDRPTVLFTGTTRVSSGSFSFSFVVPKDISYSDDPVQMLVYAVSDDKMMLAHGESLGAAFVGEGADFSDSEGPIIACYLDSQSAMDGIVTGYTPYFYAELSDPSGINLSEAGFGHNLQLCIDGKSQYTYDLNRYFMNNTDDCSSGTVGFTIPLLDAGLHKLRFTAWDALNNQSAVVFSFMVGTEDGIEEIFSTPTDAGGTAIYDLGGRQISDRRSVNGKALYLVRDKEGHIKKMVGRRQ
ncbi:MAG: type IX secretion system sortase PorU [Prevotella sp.]|nr:type IX secretion system sortase PorU [Prevotella sp.]